MAREIAAIREHEEEVLESMSKVNSLLPIVAHLDSEGQSPPKVMIAALHSGRRIFLHFAERGDLKARGAGKPAGKKRQRTTEGEAP